MIRREVGQEWWLIAQDDHALLSGRLAEQLGNAHFSAPSSASALAGIAMHDCGWPAHDQQPTLNSKGQPLDVFETPPELGLRIWELSARRACERDDYAGLLVSLHGLALSVFATSPSPIISDSKWNMSDTRVRFEVNRFQHTMIELQESLRQRLGLRIDHPLKHGLAENSPDPKEQRLSFDYGWLAAMDRLSLCICCTAPPFAALEHVMPRAGGLPVSIRVNRPDPRQLALEPWPFANARVEVEVPFRRIAQQAFTDDAALQAACAAARIERFTVTLKPHTI